MIFGIGFGVPQLICAESKSTPRLFLPFFLGLNPLQYELNEHLIDPLKT
jgi:hypothetical protein